MLKSKHVILLFLFLLLSFPLFPQQVFTIVTDSMGITGLDGLGHSIGWCDIDNDGDLDVAFSNQNDDSFWLFRNDGDHFTKITNSAGLGGLNAYRIIWAEVTGDTFTDLILRDWDGYQRVYRNNDGYFTLITSSLPGIVVAAADFNNDGATDLLSLSSSATYILYNDGSGNFTTRTIYPYSNSFTCAVCFDYDLDGKVDVYLGTYGGGANKLLKNVEADSFVDVTVEAGVVWDSATSGVTAGDYNNDGYPDLYLGNNSSPGCKLFRNNGDGTFTDVTNSAGVLGHDDTRTAEFVDYNNDGYLDIFVSNHDFYVYSNQMYRNNGDGTFTDVGSSLGLSGQFIGDYFGTAWGDFNNDGAIDLFAVGHIDKYVLYRNDNVPGNFLTVKLVGTQSNYNGIGAMLKLWSGFQTLTRFVIAGEGMHDFHSFPVEFGLDNTPLVDSLYIFWPSGIVQRLYSIPANQFITVVEGITGISEKLPDDFYLSCQSILVREYAVFETNIPLNLMVDRHIRIYNPAGELVKSIGMDGTSKRFYWDGKSENNSELPSGVYIYTINTKKGMFRNKLILVK
ncbi:MAG TPA: hypothetical protein ENF18_06100 [candidate division WOR-3 bacterium]|uniref:ASPIC/UnbV domain-containing protein n=1 Tax=candidate division WOR-3 bacterium TaxID=2052148 RepID=A0A7C0VCF5_UNCW3|nr:hypothetical protein [candidate division WOR-3 bacterium]